MWESQARRSRQPKAAVLASGGLSVGISSSISGGDFWSGVRQGLITSGLNHLAHQVLPGEQDPPKKSYDEMTPGERDHAYMQSLIPLNKFLLDAIEVFQGVQGVFSLGNLVKNGLSKAPSIASSSNATKGGLSKARALGIAGEEAVGVGSKTRIPSLTGTAKYRIPD